MYGSASVDGRRLFRQYDRFGKGVFVGYPREMERGFRRVPIIAGRAPRHGARVAQNGTRRPDGVGSAYPPCGSPDLSVMGEYWGQQGTSFWTRPRTTATKLHQDVTECFRHKGYDPDPAKYPP